MNINTIYDYYLNIQYTILIISINLFTTRHFTIISSEFEIVLIEIDCSILTVFCTYFTSRITFENVEKSHTSFAWINYVDTISDPSTGRTKLLDYF